MTTPVLLYGSILSLPSLPRGLTPWKFDSNIHKILPHLSVFVFAVECQLTVYGRTKSLVLPKIEQLINKCLTWFSSLLFVWLSCRMLMGLLKVSRSWQRRNVPKLQNMHLTLLWSMAERKWQLFTRPTSCEFPKLTSVVIQYSNLLICW